MAFTPNGLMAAITAAATEETKRQAKAPARSRVHVDTREYEFAHGRKPRGTGLWWFHVVDQQGETMVAVQYTGTYTEARHWAVGQAQQVGSVDVVVGS
jgi:hypothetical protein